MKSHTGMTGSNFTNGVHSPTESEKSSEKIDDSQTMPFNGIHQTVLVQNIPARTANFPTSVATEPVQNINRAEAMNFQPTKQAAETVNTSTIE
jgi:hypothetical protein